MSAAANIRIEAINSPQAFEEFARLPYEVYADREAWWPPDIRNEVDLLAGRTLTAPYLGLLEHACARGGVPVYFDRGTRRPDPAGRAFLARHTVSPAGQSAKLPLLNQVLASKSSLRRISKAVP